MSSLAHNLNIPQAGPNLAELVNQRFKSLAEQVKDLGSKLLSEKPKDLEGRRNLLKGVASVLGMPGNTIEALSKATDPSFLKQAGLLDDLLDKVNEYTITCTQSCFAHENNTANDYVYNTKTADQRINPHFINANSLLKEINQVLEKIQQDSKFKDALESGALDSILNKAQRDITDGLESAEYFTKNKYYSNKGHPATFNQADIYRQIHKWTNGLKNSILGNSQSTKTLSESDLIGSPLREQLQEIHKLTASPSSDAVKIRQKQKEVNQKKLAEVLETTVDYKTPKHMDRLTTSMILEPEKFEVFSETP